MSSVQSIKVERNSMIWVIFKQSNYFTLSMVIMKLADCNIHSYNMTANVFSMLLLKKVSEYVQEIPQSHTDDQPMAP